MEKIVNTLRSLFQGNSQASALEELPEWDPLLNALIEQVRATKTFYDIKLKELEAGQAVMGLDPERSLELLRHTYKRFLLDSNRTKGNSHWKDYVFQSQLAVIKAMTRRKLAYSEADIVMLLNGISESKNVSLYFYPVNSILSATERWIETDGLNDKLSEVLNNVAERIEQSTYSGADERRQASRARALGQMNSDIPFPLVKGEVWAEAALESINELPLEQKELWKNLLILCSNSKSARPNKKWQKEAKACLDDIGESSFLENVIRWFALVGQPRTFELTKQHEWQPDPNLLFDEGNADVLKGLVWCASLISDSTLARTLSKVGIESYKKVPGVGPKCGRVGNAVIYALSTMPGQDGLFQLSALKVRVKQRQALSLIDKALTAAAEREGFTLQQLAEMGVPAYGLDSVGEGEQVLGEHTALLSVVGSQQVMLRWRKSDGKVQKGIPAAVKEHFPDELKELRGQVKDIKSMLSVQKERLEQLFLAAPSWKYADWSEYYLNHPLVGVLARKMIWVLGEGNSRNLAIAIDGEWRTVTGDALEEPAADSLVSLWHPIDSAVDEIQQWRDRLMDLEVTQPFKQAHREVYLLTDAERNTNVYSNRFASHIIKQHQFNALAVTRGWRYTLQGCWDGGGEEIARITLPQYNLAAEFWVNAIGEYGSDTTEAGIFLYLSTDQVRFYQLRTDIDELTADNIDRQRPLPLDQVPALAFSEILRDVDLYVGVCSVGNDPEWSDGGPDGRYRDYWQSMSFGELSASAETRKAILERLIPKLAIGPQCRFIDRFLVVEGKRRVYKIHMGSGNILMEPNNQYLCIVTGRGGKDQEDVYLPFEGDRTLSIILSKAVLLAADEKITDQTINSQINHT